MCFEINLLSTNTQRKLLFYHAVAKKLFESMHVAELHHQLRQRSLEFSLENGLKLKKKSEEKCWNNSDTKANGYESKRRREDCKDF